MIRTITKIIVRPIPPPQTLRPLTSKSSLPLHFHSPRRQTRIVRSFRQHILLAGAELLKPRHLVDPVVRTRGAGRATGAGAAGGEIPSMVKKDVGSLSDDCLLSDWHDFGIVEVIPLIVGWIAAESWRGSK